MVTVSITRLLEMQQLDFRLNDKTASLGLKEERRWGAPDQKSKGEGQEQHVVGQCRAKPEVPTVVGHTLRWAVGGRSFQHHDLHPLAGIALDGRH
jgi:hypothetical protein